MIALCMHSVILWRVRLIERRCIPLTKVKVLSVTRLQRWVVRAEVEHSLSGVGGDG